MAGRPEKLTPAIARRLVAGVKLGLPMKYAAQRAGVGARTVRTWQTRNEPKYKALTAAIKRAEGDFIAAHVARIDTASKKGTWQASAWMLERRDPEDFSAHRAELKALRDEISRLLKLIGEPGGPIGPTPLATPPGEPVHLDRHHPPEPAGEVSP